MIQKRLNIAREWSTVNVEYRRLRDKNWTVDKNCTVDTNCTIDTSRTVDTNCTPAHLQYFEGFRSRVRCVLKHYVFLGKKIHKFNLQEQNIAMTAPDRYTTVMPTKAHNYNGISLYKQWPAKCFGQPCGNLQGGIIERMDTLEDIKWNYKSISTKPQIQNNKTHRYIHYCINSSNARLIDQIIFETFCTIFHHTHICWLPVLNQGPRTYLYPLRHEIYALKMRQFQQPFRVIDFLSSAVCKTSLQFYVQTAVVLAASTEDPSHYNVPTAAAHGRTPFVHPRICTCTMPAKHSRLQH